MTIYNTLSKNIITKIVKEMKIVDHKNRPMLQILRHFKNKNLMRSFFKENNIFIKSLIKRDVHLLIIRENKHFHLIKLSDIFTFLLMYSLRNQDRIE